MQSFSSASAGRWGNWARLLLAVALVFGLSSAVQRPGALESLLAQERNPGEVPPLKDVEPGARPAVQAKTGGKEKKSSQRTWLQTIYAGGWIGGVIIIMSVVAVGFIVEHFLSIRKERLMPEQAVRQLEDMIAHGQYQEAAAFCREPQNYSLASDVILAGLDSYLGSEFGFAEYKSAVEEAGEDNTARLYRKTDALNVIAALTPMLGLFGTVEGMIESFNQIAATEGAAKPADLADSISKALVTTWLGLVVAIPAMGFFSYFRNKIDSLVSECGKRVERVLLPLGRKRS